MTESPETTLSAGVTTEHYDKDATRLLVGGKLVGFALRHSDGRWGMYDPEDRRIGNLAYRTPKDVAAAFERRHPARKPC